MSSIIYMEVFFVDYEGNIYDWEDTQLEVINGPEPLYETRALRVLYQDEWVECEAVDALDEEEWISEETIYDCIPWCVRIK